MNHRIRLVVSGALVVAASVGLAELLVRSLLDPPALYPKPQETAVMAPHPVRGYALRPGASGVYRAGGHAGYIQINARGFRDGPFAEAVAAPFRILAIGDSFTLGLGVDSTDPWPEQLEKLFQALQRDARVVDAGVPGYSARQMRQTAEEVIPELRPQIVVFGMNGETYWRVMGPYVYRGGQLVRSSVSPRVTVGPKGLYYSQITKWAWLRAADLWMNQHFELGAHLLNLAQRVYNLALPSAPKPDVHPPAIQPILLDTLKMVFAPVLVEIGKMDSVARVAGASLVVLLINPQESDGTFRPAQGAYNSLLLEFCRRRGIRVLDPLPLLASAAKGLPIFRTSDDYHWTREAHRLVAEDLYRYLSREALLGGSR